MAEQATVHEAEAEHAARRRAVPDAAGFFGKYGGQYLPPQLEAPFAEITKAYHEIENDAAFIAELRYIRKHFQGRPTPVYHARTLSMANGGAQIYLKREDLNHTGAHKLNHCMGEGLLAKYMGKKKLIAETGAGQHGVALATAAAHFGLECEIHMGIVDIEKQAPNVSRMQLLGATVVPVTHGLQTLKEAVDSAFEAYLADYENSIYCIGSVVGPHPFPLMVRDFQKVVGMEAREQFIEMTGNLPDVVEACVGGGSNAMGIFSGFLDDPVELIGVEPLGRGEGVGEHAATMTYGTEGVIHGFRCYLLQDEQGEPAPVYSCASGLDYPGVGPEHSYLKDSGRVQYVTCSRRCLPRRLLRAQPQGGHHPGAGERARRGARARQGARDEDGDHPRQPQRSRRQGHGLRDRALGHRRGLRRRRAGGARTPAPSRPQDGAREVSAGGPRAERTDRGAPAARAAPDRRALLHARGGRRPAPRGAGAGLRARHVVRRRPRGRRDGRGRRGGVRGRPHPAHARAAADVALRPPGRPPLVADGDGAADPARTTHAATCSSAWTARRSTRAASVFADAAARRSAPSRAPRWPPP